VAEYSSARARLDLAAGLNFDLLGQLRLGWRETQVRNRLDTGLDIYQALVGAAPERANGGWLLALDLEQADSLYFPRRGWSLQASYYDSARRDYSRAAFEARSDRTLFVRVAADVPYERVVEALDVAESAGAGRIGLVADEAARRQ